MLIDQSAIGRTPRSNPAAYTGSFTCDLFAETAERVFVDRAQVVSFNVKALWDVPGNGTIAVEVNYLPTVLPAMFVAGSALKKIRLVKYKEHLQGTWNDCRGSNQIFEDIPSVMTAWRHSVIFVGYLKLGQSATTLSGGEAQRVKISSELYRPHVEKTIYLLDEPTVGLHYEDVRKLIEILQKLVDKGNSVILIEHNMDVIKSSDYVIDIGPEGGEGGGQIVARGTPEQIAASPLSHTGKYLKKVLKKK